MRHLDRARNMEEVPNDTQETKGGQRAVGQQVAGQPSQTVMGDVGEQHPHFLGRAFVLPAFIELQTATLIRAELGFGATALIVELRCGNACQLERAEQIGVLPAGGHRVTDGKRLERVTEAGGRAHTPDPFVVAYHAPAFDLLRQECGPAVGTTLGQDPVAPVQQPVDVVIAAKTLIESPHDFTAMLGWQG